MGALDRLRKKRSQEQSADSGVLDRLREKRSQNPEPRMASEEVSLFDRGSVSELRDRYEQMTNTKLTPIRSAPVPGGISEGSEHDRGSVSELRENFGRFEREQPEAAATLKRLAEERAAREAEEKRSTLDSFIKAKNPLADVMGILETGLNLSGQRARDRIARAEEAEAAMQGMSGESLFDDEYDRMQADMAQVRPLDYLLAMTGYTEEEPQSSAVREMQAAAEYNKGRFRDRFVDDLSPAVGEKVAGVAADVLLTGEDMVGDMMVGGAHYLPYMSLRGGASSAQQALDEGYSAEKASALGVASGLTSAAIESFGGIAGKWGAKAAGKVAGTAIGKKVLGSVPKEVGAWISKAAGSRLGRVAEAMASEGTEEFTEYYVQNFFENLILDKETPYDVKDALYNALIGGISGGLHTGAIEGVDAIGQKVGDKMRAGEAEEEIPELRALAEQPETTAEATTEATKATTEARNEEDTLRTNVQAAEAVSDPGEEFAAEEAKTAPAPHSVGLSGEEANISSARQADEAVRAFAKSLGEHGQAAFMAAEEISGEEGGGRAAWQTFYNAGKWGKDMAWADRQNPAARALLVGDLTAEQAFRAGQMDAEAELKKAAESRRAAQNTGALFGDGVKSAAPEVRAALVSVAKAFGARIELADLGDSRIRGAYDRKTGTIRLNSGAGLQGALINVAKHEVTHQLQDEAPEAYAAFKNYVSSELYRQDGRSFDDLVQEQIDAYAGMGQQISRSEAEDEVVANATEAFLTDEESIRKLCEKDKSLGRKILDKIRDVISKIARVLKGGELEQEAAQMLSEDMDVLRKAEEMWLKAMAARDGDMKKASVQESTKAKRYELSANFTKDFDRWYSSNDGTNAGAASIFVGTTSDTLKSIGVKDYKIFWRTAKMSKIMKEHPEMTAEVMKKVPELLENPVIVMQSNTVANRITVMGEVYADDGKPVLAALELSPQNKRGEVMDFAVIASAYGKNAAQSLIDSSDILYVDPDKKRTDSWLKLLRLQLPSRLTSYGSIASVTYSKRDVNGNLSFGEDGGKTAMELAFEKADKKHYQLTPEARERGRLIRERGETEKTAPPEESSVRYQLAADKYKGKSLSEDSSVYDYDFLVSLPDMQVTVLPETASALRGDDGRISAGEVVKEGMKNARTVGTERDGKVYVRNSYTGRELMITVSSIRHSVDGSANRLLTNSRLGTVIGDVVKNAVPVNGLYNKAEGVAGTYAMAAYAADSQGREFVGIVTVEQWTGDVAGVDVYDVTHSLSGRQKKKGIRSDTKSQGFYPTTNTSVISIADFLEIVNSTHQSVLSDDVLERLGEERNPAGYYSDRVKFQLTPEARERGRLIRENERLKKANAHLKEGFKLTKGVQVSGDEVAKLARKVLKKYSSKADAGALADELVKVYRYLGNDPEPNWETVNEVLSAAAGKVLEESGELDRSLWEETAELRERIRETPVYVPEDQRGDFARADGYQAFKRSHSRMFRIVNDPNAMSVDQLYTELAEDYPFMLDGEAVSAYDQLQEIADFIEASKPRWQNPFGENLEEMTAELVGEMYDAYFDLPQVKTFADKKQAEIDQMRMKHRAAMRELKEAERIRREELEAQIRDRYERRIEEMKDSAKAREARLQYEKWWGVQAEKIAAREAREKARDRRFISEQRRKIERKVKALSQALLNPTDMKSVPEGLRHAVQELVGALDMTGSRGADSKTSKAWAELQAAVVAARSDDGSGVILDPDLEIRIGEIVQNGLSLNEMNREQAEDLYKVLAALEKACRDVRIELSSGRTMSATEAARGIIEDTGAMRPYQAGTVIERGVKNFFDYDLTDPIRFAERFGGYMQDLMQMLREGHDVQTRRWNEALDYTEEMFRKAKVWKWQEAKATEFELDSGEKISLNPAQVMELYLLSKREQALNHIYRGGITTKETTRKGKVIQSERVQVTVDDVSRIVQSLTAEQKAVADRMGYFMSHQASDWGNEVSMELYGYRKFTEKHYWPISSDANYTVSQMDGNVKDGTLAGLGMTKQTVKNASNPIMIGDAFDTYSKHITQMAAYSAFVPRLEQARLVINWKTSHDDNFRSTKEALERAGGKGATQYLEKFITDLNGRGRVERSLTERFIGASKAAAIAGNMRVVVQQPTAYLRAAAEIDPKYLAQGLWGTRDTEEMKTYAPIARWKDWGFFEPGSGRQLSDLMIGKHDLRNVVSDAAMAPAGMMDNLTWGTLWNAVKAETQAKTDLEPGSEDFLQEAGRRFAEIVDRTQVVDSVFHRTQAMRSGNVLTKMSTAFMAEPLKSLNMITGEIHNMVQAKGFKAKAKAGAGLARNVTAFMASAILNAFVVAFVDAERDDDDEERYWEKYRQALFGEYTAEMTFRDRAKAFLSADLTENLNPLGMIPYVRDLMSMYQGYDIQRTDVQGIAELMDDLLKWGKLLNGESRYTVKYLTQETASSLSKVLGLPVANIIREVVSLGNLGLTIADGQGADTTWLRYTFAKLNLDMAHSSNKNTFVSFMLEARMAGDTELATRIFNDMIEAGWRNDELESAMTTRAKKLLEDHADVLDAYNAAEERADAAGMEAAADELLGQGFTSAEIVKAAKSRKNSLEPEEEEAVGEQIGEDFWSDYGDEGASFDAGFLATALVNGDRASAREAEAQLRASGKTQKEIDSAVASELKKRIVQSMGYEKISDLPEGVYLDMDSEEYRVLHDVYGKTQFDYGDAALAYTGAVSIGYSQVVNDMIGMKYSTSAGEKVYTKDLIREKVTEKILDWYKKGRYDGSADREQLTRWKNALDNLGISGEELEEKYRKYEKGKR